MQKKQLYDAKKRYGLLIRETKKPKVSEAKKRELELLVASMQNKHGRSLSTSQKDSHIKKSHPRLHDLDESM